MKIDCRGHVSHIPYIKMTIESEIVVWQKTLQRIGPEKSDKIKDLIFENPIYIHSQCQNCGVSLRFSTTDKGETYTSTTECPYKDGHPPIVVNLEVPSGEILLFNDFRRFYQEPSEFISINSTQGIKQYTEHYAKQGLVMHFVGNTCPSVVQVNNERLEIGYYGCEKEDGCDLPECPMPECPKVNELGSICTDLWWYCAVDRDAFEKRIGKSTEQYQKEYHATGAWPTIIRAKVSPGTYRTVGQYHVDSDKLYSYLERITE